MKLIINDFDELEVEVQKDIRDFIASRSLNFTLEEEIYSCDTCGNSKNETKPIDSEGGIFRLCFNCYIESKKVES